MRNSKLPAIAARRPARIWRSVASSTAPLVSAATCFRARCARGRLAPAVARAFAAREFLGGGLPGSPSRPSGDDCPERRRWKPCDAVSKPGSGPARGRRQSASQSSSPTDSRSRPAGTRSPSQRCRDSMSERVPPRLVAFSMTRVGGLDSPGCVAVGDVERQEPAEARIADDLHGRVRLQPRRQLARRLGLPLDAHGRGSRGCGARASTGPARRRSRASRAAERVAQRALRPWRRRLRAGRRRDPRGTSSRCGARSRRRARAGGGAPASRRSHRPRRAPGARPAASRSGMVRKGLDGASSQTRSALVGRRAGLVELDDVDAPALERREEPSRSEVRAGGERNSVVRAGAARARAQSSRPRPTGRAARARRRASPSACSAATPVGCA